MEELTNQVSNRADYFFYSTVFALTGRYNSPLLLADAVHLNILFSQFFHKLLMWWDEIAIPFQ